MPFLPTNPQNHTDGGSLELDGASSVVSADVGGFTYVFVAGGVDDGISVFRLLANGTLTPVFDVSDAGLLELDGARGLSTAMVDGNTYLFAVGEADDGVSVFRVGTNGSLTNVSNVTDDGTMLLDGVSDTATARVGTSTYLYTAGTADNGISIFRVAGDGRLTYLSNQADGGALELAGVRALTTVTIGATAFLLAGGLDDGISVFSINATTGALTATANVNDTAGLNLQDVSDITTAVIGGVTYVFVAGAADSGVSVYSLSAAGALTFIENENDSAATLIAGANSVSVHSVGTASYLLVGGSENGLSVYRIENGSNNGYPAGSLTWLDNIADSGSRELSGIVATASGSVGGTSYILGAGQTDDGISAFGSVATGQLYFLGNGDPADTRLAYVNNDGGNQTSFVDNGPTQDLITTFPQEIGVDTAAGYYFGIVNGGNDGSGARLVRGSLSGGAVTVLFTFDGADNVIGTLDDEIVNSIHIDPINERLYVGIQEATGNATLSGIREYSYNPLTGAISDLGWFINAAADATKVTTGSSGFDLFDVRDFDIDFTTNTLYFTELLTGGAAAQGLYRMNMTTKAVTLMTSTVQFPTTFANGYIIDVEVDNSTNLVYFSTESQAPFGNPGYNAAQNAIWFLPEGASGATATQLTLVGLPGGHHIYPGDMVFDQVTRQLYVESEETDDTVGADTDDVIYVFQLDGAGTTGTLINTISLTPGVTSTAANLAGMHFNQIAALAGISGTASAIGEQGTAVQLLTGAPTITDADGDHLSSATVQITGGLFSSNESNATDDRLFFGTTLAASGSVGGTNIIWSYNSATNTLTFTGYDTVDNYEIALAGVRFQSLGDNPTNYGLNTGRTITWTVSDGALGVPGGSQNSATTQITITDVNDAIVNNGISPRSTAEDTPLAITGLSITDPDLNPAITDITVTITTTNGTVTLLTNVAGGLTAGDISNNGQAAVTITGTLNEINATLAALNGVVFTAVADFNGAATITIVSSDGGNTGSPGTPITDTDVINITVNAVVDIANDVMNFAEDSGAQTLTLPNNDTFENNGRFISAVTQGAHGIVTISNNNTPLDATDDFIIYTQVADYNGTDSFTYTVTSGGVTETATVNVTISAVTDIANDAMNFTEDSGPQTLSLPNNDTFENTGRFISAVTQGAHGIVTINNNGTAGDATDDFIVYTQVADYNGTDSFTYTVTSGGVTETATVNVTIGAVADIADDAVTVNEDSGANALNGIGNPVSLIANDSFENAGRFISAVTQGTHGSVAINNNGTAGDATDDYVVYTVTDPNYNGLDSFTYTVTSGGVTETATVNMTIASVNDAPVINNIDGDNLSYLEGDGTVLLDPGSDLDISDIDSTDFDGGLLTVTISASPNLAEDVIGIDTSGTVTLSAGLTLNSQVSVGGVVIGIVNFVVQNTIEFLFNADATPARVEALARAYTYTNIAGDTPFGGARTISWTVVDGDGGTQQTTAISLATVVPVNDAPEGADGTVTASEDDPYPFTLLDFGFSDVEGDDPAGVVLTTLPVEGDLRLNGVNITVAGTFISATDIAAGLLTFLADPDEFGDAYATFTFQVRDDGGILNTGQDTDQSANTMTIDVEADNSPPVVDLNTGTGGNDDTNIFAEDNGPSGIGVAIGITDVEGDAITRVTVTITDPSAGDLLTTTLPLPPGITVDPASTATTLILVGSATASAYEAALGQVAYANTGDDPTAGGTNPNRLITVTATDAFGTGPAATMTMSVFGTNDQPTLIATGGTPVFTEGGAAVDLFSGVTASTVEAGQTLTSLTLTVSNVTDGAAEILRVNGVDVALTNGNSANVGVGTATVTLAGSTATLVVSGMTLSAGQLQTLIDGLAYRNSSEIPTDADRVVTITELVDSGSNVAPNDNTTALSLAATVNVNPVNDAPQNVVPGTQAINEDGSVTLTTISVSDVDASTLTVTLSVAHGTLTIASTLGLTFQGGSDGTGDVTMVFSGTAAAINAALGAGLTYNPNADFNGSDAISVVTTDNGESGGPAQTDTDSVTVNITAINDAPVVAGDGTEQAADINEDVPGPGQTIIALFNGQYSDAADNQIPNGGASSPGQFSGIAVTGNGSSLATGQWQYSTTNGVSWADIGSVSDSTALLLGSPFSTLIRFTPALDYTGQAPTLTVHLIDNSLAFSTGDVVDISGLGATGGTTAYSADTVVLGQYIIPDNLPPTVDLNGAGVGINYSTTFVEDGAAVGIGSGIVVAEQDAIPDGNLVGATVTLTDRVAGDSLVLSAPLPLGFSATITPNLTTITIEISGSGTPAQYQAILSSIVYATTNQDPTVGGTDPTRTVTVTVDDGQSDSAVATTTINITPIDDLPVAQPDAFTIAENGSIVGGNLFASNGSGADTDPDGPPLTISAVNGSGANVGTQIVLASGALLTVNANGTFSYDPGTAFLPTPAAGSGASNTPGHEVFTYTLDGGNTVTVNITLTGLDTNDTLLGTAGADILMGGNGNDIYFVDNAGDMVVEASGQGFDKVYASVSYTLAAGSSIESLSAVSAAATTAIDLTGNELNNNVYGNAGANTLNGGAGADMLVGYGGNDIYFVDNVGDMVVEASGQGFDKVYASVSYTLAAGSSIESLSAVSAAATTAIDLTGNELNNNVYGNAGANTLNGGAGADMLVGYGGNDIYFVDNVGDMVVEASGQGFDKVYASVSYTLAAGSSIESLSAVSAAATTAIDLTGNELNNNVYGNAGANTLNGGAGADMLVGYGGNDIYFVDNAGDMVVEGAGGGNDSVYASVSYTLGAGQEIELFAASNFSATTALNLTGNELANTIYGNDGNNVLDGKGGNDLLVGLMGADTFAFTTALGAGNVDVVFGFTHGTDKIALDDAVFTAIGALGTLNANAFVTGSAAADGSDRIIYNSLTGQLFYDADGTGAGAAVQFATMSPGLTLTASDFLVI